MVALPAGLQSYGAGLQSLIEGFGALGARVSRILHEEGIGKLDTAGLIKIEKNSWYPVSNLLRAYARIEGELGGPALYRAGLSIPAHAILPAGIRDIAGAPRAVNLAYYINHGVDGLPMLDVATGAFRHDIGGYRTRLEGDRRVLVECATIYPCDLGRGIVEALARRFERDAVLAHGADAPCRKRGGLFCSYSVAW